MLISMTYYALRIKLFGQETTIVGKGQRELIKNHAPYQSVLLNRWI